MRASYAQALVLGCLVLCVSCAPIRREGDVYVARGGLDRLVYGDYWEARGLPGGQGQRDIGNKFAIAEFNVQFVTERVLHLPDSRGNALRTMAYPDDLKSSLPSQLHALFIKKLRERGRELIPSATVTASNAYGRYATRGAGSAVERHDEPISGSAGMIRITETHSASGLDVLTGSEADLSANDRALAKETGADVVLRVTCRVGIFKGQATLEQGCTVHATSSELSGVVESKRTLASAKSAIFNGVFVPSGPGNYRVETRRFVRAINTLFPTYLGLATEALE